MSDTVKMIAVLTIVGLSSGGFLTFVYQQTAPKAERKSLESLRQAILMVLPEAVGYKELKLGEEILYQGIDKNGKEAGLAFLAKGGGYQGEIKIMVGVEQDLNKLQNIQVLESVETPGLGGNIIAPEFKAQFKGLAVRQKITYLRNRNPNTPKKPGEIDAITGATISSKAVVDIINQKIATVKEIMKEQE